MSITIPEELAKRVLEALEEKADDAEEHLLQQPSWHTGEYADLARREAMEARTLADELAALLTPKEAT